MSLLVRDALILTQDAARRRVRGNVYVEDGVIAAIGEKPVEADHVVRADGALLIPGIVNAHTHLPMSLLRGYGDDLPLMQWLTTRIWPAENRMDEQAIRVGMRLGLLEMIRGGSTTFLDMYMFAQAMAEETDRAGVRGFVGWGLADVGQTPSGLAHTRMPEVDAFLRAWKDHPRVHGSPAPHAVYTCHDETIAACADLARRYAAPLNIHAHETRDEVYEAEAKRGKRPLQILADLDALDRHTVLAHCGWLTKAEVKHIARSGAAVSHNPVSNMKLATGGTTPLPELLEAGVAVGLGTDGAASNNSLDMFETMKVAALVHKQARWDARVADAQTVFDLATRAGAEALGIGALIGSIEVGKRADLALIDVAKPHLTPLHDPVSQIVYAARASDVALTVVDGRVLYEGGRFFTLDEAAVRAQAQATAERLVADPKT